MIINKYHRCKQFYFNKNKIYIVNSENELIINEKFIEKANYFISGSYNDNIVLFNEENFQTKILNSHGETINNIFNYGLTLRHKLNKDIYIVGINYGDKITRGLYDITEFKLIKEIPKFGFRGVYLLLHSKEYFISRDNEKLGLFNIDNKIIWQHSFSELMQSEKASLYGKILLSNNKLFFNLGDLQKGGLFCLEAKTGEVLQYFKDSDYEIFTDEDFIYTTKFENILCRINTKTLELEEWDCNALIIENGFENIHDHRCEAFNSKFYFTQTLGDNKAKLGILDWDKKQLVYKHNFEPQNGGIGSIQVNETRMFVHTQDNTLHIFEEEEL